MTPTTDWHGRLNYGTYEIFESPKEIPDMAFAVAHAERGAEWLATLKADASYRELGEFSGFKIYSSSNYIFTEHDGRLSYFVRYEDRAFPGSAGKFVTQIAVERDKSRTPPGIATHIFWTYLIPLHGAAMTDNAQTRLGREFWTPQAAEAWKRGAFVYFVDLAAMTARQIKTPDERDRAVVDAYGKTDRHKSLRLLITTKPLSNGFKLVESFHGVRPRVNPTLL